MTAGKVDAGHGWSGAREAQVAAIWLQASPLKHAFPFKQGEAPVPGLSKCLLQTLTDPGEEEAERDDSGYMMDSLPETLSQGAGRAGCLWARGGLHLLI